MCDAFENSRLLVSPPKGRRVWPEGGAGRWSGFRGQSRALTRDIGQNVGGENELAEQVR